MIPDSLIRSRPLAICVWILVFKLAVLLAILCSVEAKAAPTTFLAVSIRANAARIVREPAPDRASLESHVRPTPQGVPPASPFGVPSAPICNPATAGSRLSSGPGSSSEFYPVKQNGVPNLAPTLPAVAG